MDEQVQWLKQLSEADGVSGFEGEVKELLKEKLAGCSEISYDKTGSVLFRAHGGQGGPKIMLAAHMDEIGFLVKHITKEGFLKFTNLGLYTQAVGINESSSRLNGLNPAFIKFITFVILGLCVAVAGLIKVSRLSSINYSVIAKDIEMDAILAVALGGNSLSGGKFNMTASILGAYVIQFLTTTLYKFNVQSDALSAYKAVVVIVLVVLSTPVVREYLSSLGKKLKNKRNVKEVG